MVIPKVNLLRFVILPILSTNWFVRLQCVKWSSFKIDCSGFSRISSHAVNQSSDVHLSKRTSTANLPQQLKTPLLISLSLKLGLTCHIDCI